MNRNTSEVATGHSTSKLGFGFGVLAGTVIGAGLIMWLAPRAAAEARRSMTDSANALREGATEQYGRAGRKIAAAVEDLASKGNGVRDDAADAVARGAHEVERIAVAVKSVPVTRQL